MEDDVPSPVAVEGWTQSYARTRVRPFALSRSCYCVHDTSSAGLRVTSANEEIHESLIPPRPGGRSHMARRRRSVERVDVPIIAAYEKNSAGDDR